MLLNVEAFENLTPDQTLKNVIYLCMLRIIWKLVLCRHSSREDQQCLSSSLFEQHRSNKLLLGTLNACQTWANVRLHWSNESQSHFLRCREFGDAHINPQGQYKQNCTFNHGQAILLFINLISIKSVSICCEKIAIMITALKWVPFGMQINVRLFLYYGSFP